MSKVRRNVLLEEYELETDNGVRVTVKLSGKYIESIIVRDERTYDKIGVMGLERPEICTGIRIDYVPLILELLNKIYEEKMRGDKR